MINTLLINSIVEHIKIEVIKYKHKLDTRGCKNKISYETLIKIFINKLQSNLTWLELGKIYNISKSYLNDTFIRWSNHNVFKTSFENFLTQYHLYIDNGEAYIDTTTTFNKYGYIDTVGYNSYESKKHKCNKISVLSSKNGIPLGIHIDTGNIHDINLFTLPNKIDFNTLYADKSYISNALKYKLLHTRQISLITPYKINQYKENADYEKKGLKHRMRIEHLNNKLKQNKSLNTRYMKELTNFKSLAYIGCLKIGFQVILKDFYNF